jgi:hypothetical protein
MSLAAAIGDRLKERILDRDGIPLAAHQPLPPPLLEPQVLQDCFVRLRDLDLQSQEKG